MGELRSTKKNFRHDITFHWLINNEILVINNCTASIVTFWITTEEIARTLRDSV